MFLILYHRENKDKENILLVYIFKMLKNGDICRGYIHSYAEEKMKSCKLKVRILMNSSVNTELSPFQEKSETEWKENPSKPLFGLQYVLRGSRTESDISPSNFNPADLVL